MDAERLHRLCHAEQHHTKAGRAEEAVGHGRPQADEGCTAALADGDNQPVAGICSLDGGGEREEGFV